MSYNPGICSTQELMFLLKNMALYLELELILFIIKIKWALRWQIRVLFVIESAAAHKFKPGLSLTVKKVYGRCQQKRIHCSHDISWNLPYHTRSFKANDKDIANHNGKIFRTEGRNKAAKY